jgi:hypothetical protein
MESFLDKLEHIAKNEDSIALIDPSPSDCHYFSRLHCTFTSSESSITSQYIELMKKRAEVYNPSITLESDTVLKRALQLMFAYKIIMSSKVSIGNKGSIRKTI